MNSITRSDDLRTSNRRAVLRAVRRNRAQSRTDLSAVTGLSPATLSAISTDLLQESILLEGPHPDADNAKSRRGRPSMQLTPNPSAALIAAVTLTLNEIGVLLVDYSGKIIFRQCEELSTQSLKRSEIAAAVIMRIADSLEHCSDNTAPLTHIELAFQGVTDVSEGILMWSPIIAHRGIALRKKLRQKFNVSVSINNDCSMIARALHEQMQGELGSTFAAVLFSHGIGMGVYHDNRLVSGARSSATEFGHMLHQPNGALCRCGKRGCIEAYAADYAIWRRANGIAETQPPEAIVDVSELHDLIARARASDELACQAFTEAGHAIGTGLGNLYALLDSFPVAFVGPITEAFDLMESAVRDGIRHGLRDAELNSIPILCFSDDHELIRQGCIQAALDAVDANCFIQGGSAHA